jgi:hypothetical protein
MEKFERVAPRLYRRTYETADGAESTLYYARFVCKLKRKRRMIPLGSEQRTAKNELKVLDARNIRREDFDFDRPKPEPKADPKPTAPCHSASGRTSTRSKTASRASGRSLTFA